MHGFQKFRRRYLSQTLPSSVDASVTDALCA
jgi:hypothetical protein